MATCSSIFAWEISSTEEPGELQSMGTQKDWTRLTKTKTQHLLDVTKHRI